jgi:hypothetical protein
MSAMADLEAGGGRTNGPEPRPYYGKYPAVVIDNGPPEDGEHRGEIKVRVPGILEETPDGEGNRALETIASPCLPPGCFFVPENDDRVWVEFAAGDINFPIWTGVWYPLGKSPRTVDGKAPTERQRVIRTKEGMVIQLDDTEGGEQVIISDGTGKSTITMAKGGIMIAQDKAVVVEISSSGSIKLYDRHALMEDLLGPLLDFLEQHQHTSGMGPTTGLDPGAIVLHKALKAKADAGKFSSKKSG